MRLTARLVNAADGLTLWSDVYESEEKDLFAVQDRISQSIVAALGSELGGAGSDSTAAAIPASPGTANMDAYNQYLRGRFFFERRGEASLRQALGYYQKAVATDPRYALAYAGIADVYAVLPLYSNLPAAGAWARGLEAADRAIAIDTALAEGYAARGNLLNGMWRWSDARNDLRRAIALRPSYATAHQWYGENLLLNGQVADAVRELGRATELDPVSPIVSGSYALALGIAGRNQEAVARATQAIELDPSMFVTRWMLGTVHLYGGQVDSAIRELESAASLAGDVPAVRGTLGYAYAVSGDRQRATAILAQIEAKGTGDNVASAAARVRIGLGDTTQALAGLERAAQRHDTFFASESMASPLFDPLRRSARFQALLRRVNLDSVVAVGRGR
jgi:serine/threonine-protein kinase